MLYKLSMIKAVNNGSKLDGGNKLTIISDVINYKINIFKNKLLRSLH